MQTRSRGLAATLAALLFAASATACAPTRVSLREGPREYVATDYEDVLDVWTRDGDLLSLAQLDNLLHTTATYESWEFRWAYVVRYVEDYRLTLEQRKKLLNQTLAETQTGHHFFVAISGGERRFNDLTQPESAWIVRLIDSTGNETAPDEIKAIKRPTPIERTYYPYVTVFHQVFRVRFPRFTADGKPVVSPDAEWFGLRFAGAQGHSELRWEIDRDLPADPDSAATAPVKAAEGGSSAPTTEQPAGDANRGGSGDSASPKP
ncbi:MAG: hypothetical protein U0271_13440 [Polyangiaceae bacterium]